MVCYMETCYKEGIRLIVFFQEGDVWADALVTQASTVEGPSGHLLILILCHSVEVLMSS